MQRLAKELIRIRTRKYIVECWNSPTLRAPIPYGRDLLVLLFVVIDRLQSLFADEWTVGEVQVVQVSVSLVFESFFVAHSYQYMLIS